MVLGESIHADLLLIDDRAGAILAQRRGLAVTGTLGVLDLASQARLLHLQDTFSRLQKTNFRYPPSLMEILLKEERNRKTGNRGRKAKGNAETQRWQSSEEEGSKEGTNPHGRGRRGNTV